MSCVRLQLTDNPILDENLTLLGQIQDILSTVSESDYLTEHRELGIAPIGKHVRHILDFYECLLRDLDAREINYDNRERVVQVERSRTFALGTTDRIRSQLSHIDKQLIVKVASLISENGSTVVTSSTLMRELAFLAGHTTHHLAIVAIIIRLNGKSPDPALGVSVSTRANLERLRNH